MRPWILIPLVLLAGALLLVGTTRPEAARSVAGIAKSTVTAGKHQLPMLQIGRLAMRASHNHAVIERAAEYAGVMGSNTSIYRGIAEAAADLDADCPDLDRVLDLAVVCGSDGGAILALARSACRTTTPEEVQRWEDVYAQILSVAQYPDVESALAANTP